MTTETPISELHEHADFPSAPECDGRAASKEGEISQLDLLIVLVERKRIIFCVTAIFAILAIAISLPLPVRYTATVTLLLPQQSYSMSSALASQPSSMGGMAALAIGSLGLKNANDMYVDLFKSRTVEDAMVQHFGQMQEYHAKLASDARKAFENLVTVDGSAKDGMVHITVQDRDPPRAADIANGYVDQFRLQSQHLAITEASQRRFFFEQQLEQAMDKLANAEEAMKQAEQETGVIQLDSQAKALIESAASLQAEVAAKVVQIQEMQIYATGENSQVVQAQQEPDSMRAQLAKLGGSEVIASGGLIVPKGHVPEASLDYVRKLRDMKYNETIFDIQARQFESAKLDEAKQGALIQVVDPAVPPDRRSFPKRGLIVIAAAAIWFLIGIFVVLLQAAFARIKSDPEASGKLAFLKKEPFFTHSVRDTVPFFRRPSWRS